MHSTEEIRAGYESRVPVPDDAIWDAQAQEYRRKERPRVTHPFQWDFEEFAEGVLWAELQVFEAIAKLKRVAQAFECGLVDDVQALRDLLEIVEEGL